LPPAAARKAPREIQKMRRSHTDDNFKFFFGGVRITDILTNFSLGGKFFSTLKKGVVE